MTEAEILEIFHGSDGNRTMTLYEHLQGFGPRGDVAVNLFRACKTSGRAKVYRGGVRGRGSYRRMAYDRKQWAIQNLCAVLTRYEAIRWGWGRDPAATNFEHVLFVDVPGCGQVSFHSPHRDQGPDYPGTWDGVTGEAPARICKWCARILAGEQDGLSTGTEGTGAEGVARAARRDDQQAFDL